MTCHGMSGFNRWPGHGHSNIASSLGCLRKSILCTFVPTLVYGLLWWLFLALSLMWWWPRTSHLDALQGFSQLRSWSLPVRQAFVYYNASPLARLFHRRAMGAATRGVGLAMGLWDGASGLGFLLLFLVDLLGTAATNLEPIYWNSLNKR